MKEYRPVIYDRFRCLAGQCPDSCCHQWQVQVDDASAARYRALPGPLGDALRASLITEDGETLLENQQGRCPMWRADGLCRIQAELGEDALCDVCREFPRIRQDYGDFVELGLEMSCPEAARLMLDSEDLPMLCRELPDADAPEYDPELMALLRSSRGYALGLLELHGYTVPQRMAILMLYGYQIQSRIDGADPGPFDPETALEEAMGFAGPGDWEPVLDFYRDLEILTPTWRALLDAPGHPAPWDERFARLAQYGIRRYWYQAVSDWDLAPRVKLVVLHCLLSRYLGGKTEHISLYAKEIENDIDNIEAILDGAYTQSGLTDRNLLGLLLNPTQTPFID